MRPLHIILLPLLFILLGFLHAVEPTGQREWKAQSGHKVLAQAVGIDAGIVSLKKESGQIVKVPLDKFIESDQDQLRKHFKISDAPPKAAGSGDVTAQNLAHPLGKIIESIETKEGSTYHLYLSKNLKEGRDAPLLFYTLAGGGKAKKLKEFTDYADRFGIILAVSVQSKNGNSFPDNVKHVKHCLTHLLDTLPIDKGRLHYAGSSGGGAMAFASSSVKKAYGIIPNIGYIPGEFKEDTTLVYALGGGNDYNRYLTAHAADKYKKNGFHRMSPKGHSISPTSYREDGFFWITCKYLHDEKKNHLDEVKDFELAALNWIERIQKKDPARAYSNALFFKERYAPTGANATALDKTLKELAENPHNPLYHQALLDIDEYSGKYYPKFGSNGGSKFKHSDASAVNAAAKLSETYSALPDIVAILEAIQQKTVTTK